MDEATLSRLVRVLPNFGSADPTIRATAAQAAHAIVLESGACWRDLLRQRPSPLAVEPVHWRQAVQLALDSSEVEPSEFERKFLVSLQNWHGAPTAKQRTTLENTIGRLVRGPIRIRF